jgi:hypothetical protein
VRLRESEGLNAEKRRFKSGQRQRGVTRLWQRRGTRRKRLLLSLLLLHRQPPHGLGEEGEGLRLLRSRCAILRVLQGPLRHHRLGLSMLHCHHHRRTVRPLVGSVLSPLLLSSGVFQPPLRVRRILRLSSVLTGVMRLRRGFSMGVRRSSKSGNACKTRLRSR